ncbi:MAG: GHKL domain-containing protein [Bacteroidetes bacterium]|nr:GHKL domain-containing protein [Bacteroidota bacterium]
MLFIIFSALAFGKSFGEQRPTIFPQNVLHKSYKIQCFTVDSIYDEIFYKHSQTPDSILNLFENFSLSNRDFQLYYLFAIKHYYLKIYNIQADSSIQKNISALINELEEKQLYILKAEAHQLLAEYYWTNKNYPPSLEHYIYAYHIYSPFSIDEFPHKADFLYDFGNRYYHFRDLETAKRYYLEVWRTIPSEQIPNNVSKLNTLALAYSGLDIIDSSNYYFNKANAIAEKNNDEVWVGIICGNLSTNYMKQQKYDEAIALIEKNITISEKHHQMIDLTTAYSRYGELLLIKKDSKKALEMELKSLEIIKQKNLFLNYSLIVRIYPNVAKVYAANGNMKLAYAYYDSAYIANEAWQKERNAIILSGVQHKIDVERHTAEIQKNQDEVKHQKQLQYSLTGVLAIVLIGLGVILFQQRKIKSAQSKLIQSEKMAVLGQLSASIAHEVNTPLGAIKSSSEESINSFSEILNDLSWFTHTVPENEKHAFMEFLLYSTPANQTLSTKEEREIKKNIRDRFNELGVENTRLISDRLVHVGIYEITPALETITKSHYFDKLMLLTYNLLNQQRSNQTILLAVDKASRIVKALKAYTHTTKSDEMISINLRDNIEMVLTIYHNRLKQGIQIIKDYEDVPNIYGNPDKLNQVWTNLIVNAVQAMDNNGILSIGIKREGDFVVVSIKDTGKGIPKEIQSKIFDPFFTTKNSGEGSGLGLDIIKRIVEDHNAKISFHSIEGEGTTFYVKLSLNKAVS